MARAQGNLKIIDQVDLVGQTSEFARVFGIEFYHVLSRGSQVPNHIFAMCLLVFGFKPCILPITL